MLKSSMPSLLRLFFDRIASFHVHTERERNVCARVAARNFSNLGGGILGDVSDCHKKFRCPKLKLSFVLRCCGVAVLRCCGSSCFITLPLSSSIGVFHLAQCHPWRLKVLTYQRERGRLPLFSGKQFRRVGIAIPNHNAGPTEQREMTSR